MSQEEAVREAQEKDAATAAAVAAEEGHQRTSSWGNSMRRRSSSAVPPIPSHQPPPPPPPAALSPERPPPEAEATVQRAEREARKSEPDAVPEEDVPDRVLRTTVTSPKHSHGPAGTPGERTTVLPIVEEAAEGSTTGERSRNSHISSIMTAESDGRPLTPAKDGQEMEPGFGNPLIGGHHQVGRRGRGPPPPPPTPPKTGNGYPTSLKPDSADSGYGVTGAGSGSSGGLKSASGSQRSMRVRAQISRDSLDKALPPLPRGNDPPTQGVS